MKKKGKRFIIALVLVLAVLIVGAYIFNYYYNSKNVSLSPALSALGLGEDCTNNPNDCIRGLECGYDPASIQYDKYGEIMGTAPDKMICVDPNPTRPKCAIRLQFSSSSSVKTYKYIIVDWQMNNERLKQYFLVGDIVNKILLVDTFSDMRIYMEKDYFNVKNPVLVKNVFVNNRLLNWIEAEGGTTCSDSSCNAFVLATDTDSLYIKEPCKYSPDCSYLYNPCNMMPPIGPVPCMNSAEKKIEYYECCCSTTTNQGFEYPETIYSGKRLSTGVITKLPKDGRCTPRCGTFMLNDPKEGNVLAQGTSYGCFKIKTARCDDKDIHILVQSSCANDGKTLITNRIDCTALGLGICANDLVTGMGSCVGGGGKTTV